MTDIEIEKLKSESLIELRVIARNLGVKSVTTYNKSGLIEKIKEFAELENSSNKMGLSYNNGDRQEKSNEDFGRRNNNSMAEKSGSYRNQNDGNSGQQKRILYMTPPEMNDDNKAEGVLEILPDGFGLTLSFTIVNSLTTSPSYNVLNVTTASYVPSSLISVTTVPVALFL